MPSLDRRMERICHRRISTASRSGRRRQTLLWKISMERKFHSPIFAVKSRLSKQEKENVQILTVSIDSHEDSKKFVQKLKERFSGDLDFPMLEDKNHKVIDRYGIYNPDGKGWPHPATYVIDKQGVVRWKFVEVDYKKRPTNEQILQALRKIS